MTEHFSVMVPGAAASGATKEVRCGIPYTFRDMRMEKMCVIKTA